VKQTGLSQRLKIVETRQQLWPLSSIRRDKTASSSLNFQALALGLPFSHKNYSAEYGTRQNRRQFRRNSACFAEEKNLGIPLWTISRTRKTLGLRSEPFLRREKPTEFRSEPFLDEKNSGIPFWAIFRREKTSEFRSESFPEEKKLGEKTTFVSCFVKLHYFAEFRSVPHFIPWNNDNRSESIQRNFFGTKFWWQA
jgi:hypothetical protein